MILHISLRSIRNQLMPLYSICAGNPKYDAVLGGGIRGAGTLGNNIKIVPSGKGHDADR